MQFEQKKENKGEHKQKKIRRHLSNKQKRKEYIQDKSTQMNAKMYRQNLTHRERGNRSHCITNKNLSFSMKILFVSSPPEE
jgi:hypothetical protein